MCGTSVGTTVGANVGGNMGCPLVRLELEIQPDEGAVYSV